MRFLAPLPAASEVFAFSSLAAVCVPFSFVRFFLLVVFFHPFFSYVKEVAPSEVVFWVSAVLGSTCRVGPAWFLCCGGFSRVATRFWKHDLVSCHSVFSVRLVERCGVRRTFDLAFMRASPRCACFVRGTCLLLETVTAP